MQNALQICRSSTSFQWLLRNIQYPENRNTYSLFLADPGTPDLSVLLGHEIIVPPKILKGQVYFELETNKKNIKNQLYVFNILYARRNDCP